MTPHEAKFIAQKWVADTCGNKAALFPDIRFEDVLYFVFRYNARRYVETGDRQHMWLGPGPIVLDKRDGRVFKYGSGYGIGINGMERLLEHQRDRTERESLVRRRFSEYDMRKRHRVLILKVYDARRLLELLDSFELSYAVPEVETGVVRRVPKRYDRELIQRRLAEPMPIVFGYAGEAGSAEHLYDLVAADERHRICEFDIEEYIRQQEPNPPSKSNSEDLETEW